MRSPRSFMARRSWVVTDLGSSAIDLRELAHRSIAEADDIQVQRPRSPANARAPVAAALRVDGVEVNEQLGGLEGGFEQDHLVQVCPLWHRSEGGRLLDAGLPQQAGARQGREPRARVREMRGAISSSSRVARSRSVRPRAASSARVATSSASARFFPAIAATAWMRWRSLPKALS